MLYSEFYVDQFTKQTEYPENKPATAAEAADSGLQVVYLIYFLE